MTAYNFSLFYKLFKINYQLNYNIVLLIIENVNCVIASKENYALDVNPFTVNLQCTTLQKMREIILSHMGV